VPDLVVQALQVLDIHRGEHVNAGVDERLHILPALRPHGARDVRMGQLVDQADLGGPCEDGVRVHLLKRRSPVLHLLPGNDLEAFRPGDRILPAVRLEVPDDDVYTLPVQLLRLFEHLIGLAHAGRVAHEDF
jgi:hypothetical protein